MTQPSTDPLVLARSLAMSPSITDRTRSEIIELLHELAARRRREDRDRRD